MKRETLHIHGCFSLPVYMKGNKMPVIYCSSYNPGSSSISEVTRLEHTLGRELLRHGISRFTGIELSPGELSASLGTSENGKPFLPDFPDIHFNITHCDGLAACAFDRSPVGVDAEKPGYFAEILIKKALTNARTIRTTTPGMMKLYRSPVSTFATVAALMVGPPQGTMFITA